jgi:hypothetical protein
MNTFQQLIYFFKYPTLIPNLMARARHQECYPHYIINKKHMHVVWYWTLISRESHTSVSFSFFTLHYNAFPGSKVSQNDWMMWNMSYTYKNICTVQLKFSHKNSQKYTVVTHMAIQKCIHIHQYCQLMLLTQPWNRRVIF